MLKVAIALFSLWIALYDLKTHRIRDKDLLGFALLLMISPRFISFTSALVLISLALVSCLVLNVGGGDFKLFSLLVLSQGTEIVSSQYFLRFMLAISVLVLLSFARNRNFSGSIALAPAILAPFLLGYLDI
jgi:Flp pilus assembly protein protease CpaA